MKRLVLISCLLLLPTMTYAQQPLTQAPAEYNFKIKPADVDKLGRGLAKLPFEDVAELMQSLRQQVVDQQQPPKIIDPKKK